MRFDTIISGGRVVAGDRVCRADVGIRGQKIAALGRGLASRHDRGARIVDATGRYVIPGGIDAHVHLDLRLAGMVTADDFASGTQMAACGGVTTVIDFATPGTDESLQAALDSSHARAAGKACVDYAFHMSLTNLKRQAREVPRMVAQGVPTFKQYMIYEGLRASGADVYGALELLRDAGGMLLLHAESQEVLALLVARHHRPAAMRRHGARLHAITRPNVVEAEAVDRAIRWCEATGGRLFFVHLSTAEAVDSLARAQAGGIHVRAETCAHYLVLDDRVFGRPDGHLFATCPQVKRPRDRQRLWAGLQDGTLSSVSTDTCSFTRAQKNRWGGDWTRIPMGLPGLETLLPAVYTYGVLKGRLSIAQFVQTCCTNPARIMGLYPRKGVLRVGSDADVVIFHPTRRRKVDWSKLHSRCDWHPFQGRLLAGFAEHTFSRGVHVVEDGRFHGSGGHGRFVPRRLGRAD